MKSLISKEIINEFSKISNEISKITVNCIEIKKSLNKLSYLIDSAYKI